MHKLTILFFIALHDSFGMENSKGIFYTRRHKQNKLDCSTSSWKKVGPKSTHMNNSKKNLKYNIKNQ